MASRTMARASTPASVSVGRIQLAIKSSVSRLDAINGLLDELAAGRAVRQVVIP